MTLMDKIKHTVSGKSSSGDKIDPNTGDEFQHSNLGGIESKASRDGK